VKPRKARVPLVAAESGVTGLIGRESEASQSPLVIGLFAEARQMCDRERIALRSARTLQTLRTVPDAKTHMQS